MAKNSPVKLRTYAPAGDPNQFDDEHPALQVGDFLLGSVPSAVTAPAALAGGLTAQRSSVSRP
jgi:hypothetical protein